MKLFRRSQKPKKDALDIAEDAGGVVEHAPAAELLTSIDVASTPAEEALLSLGATSAHSTPVENGALIKPVLVSQVMLNKAAAETGENGGAAADLPSVRAEIAMTGAAIPAVHPPADGLSNLPANDTPVQPVPQSKPGAATGSGFYARLKRGLSRTGNQFAATLGDLFLGKKTLDADLMEELESQLLMSDLGIDATKRIMDGLTSRVSRKELNDGEAVLQALQAALYEIIAPCEQALDIATPSPFVILVVGVNGAGKTTTIGKMAHRYKADGKRVMLAAGDTFRAAAVEQLQSWGERNQVPVIAQHTGADSASVLFDALQAAQARGVDVLIADTAGRLQNKAHLMDELEKVVRVMRKLDPTAPHETLLVLDAGTGQNAVSQAEQFDQAVGVTGLALTKLDGTARGGVIFAIAERMKKPIRFIGVGEAAEDLRPFIARDFVKALFDRSSDS